MQHNWHSMGRLLTAVPLGLGLTSPVLQTQVGRLAWWVWLLGMLVVVFIGVAWALLEESAQIAESEATDSGAPSRTVAQPVRLAAAALEAGGVTRPDDLELVKGIGPKIAAVLRAAGIMTFAQLADAEIGQLQALLHEDRFALADPTTWPEQARRLARELASR